MKLAIYGKLRAGKSVVADILKKEFDAETIEFSGALREVCDVLYPQSKNYKNRELLIQIGQHMRKLDKDICVNIVKNKIENSEKENIIVASVRQQNEYELLKEMGFKFIAVESFKDVREQRCIDVGDVYSKESFDGKLETDMDQFDWDYLIVNNRGFKELDISLQNLIEDLKNENYKDALGVYEGEKRTIWY